MPVQTRLGELDDVFVAMRDGTLDQLVFVRVARFNVLCRRGVLAEAGIKPAPRLPGIAKCRARRSVATCGAILPSAAGLVTP